MQFDLSFIIIYHCDNKINLLLTSNKSDTFDIPFCHRISEHTTFTAKLQTP